MAKGRESFEKRAREKARQEKQALKRERRHSSKPSGSDLSQSQEDVLMQQFASLSARREAGAISLDKFEEERHRIFVALGLESDE